MRCAATIRYDSAAFPGEQLGVEGVGGVEGGVAVGAGGGRQQPGGQAHACNTALVRYLDIQNRQPAASVGAEQCSVHG